MGRRVALLSNVNMNYAIRLLKQKFEVYETEGYGNELGCLLNEDSSYYKFDPQATFLIVDLMEILKQDVTADAAQMNQWFGLLESAIKPDRLYLVSDAYLWGTQLEAVCDPDRKRTLEALWQERLNRLCTEHTNVRIFPYHHLIEKLGEENAFSLKMWYLGGILLTNEAQKRLCELVEKTLWLRERTARKALILDLDNTLWGGLAGEAEHTPVILSEDHTGLAYKNLQRVILQMQSQGVLLGIVSKNNEKDAMDILEHHPHMVLRPEYFAARRINWEPKHENILQIAREWNLGTDSFVFWDDSSAERELVKKFLPEVAVPDFPARPEELAPAMTAIYHEYFEKDVLTREDLEKTSQYAANARRKELETVSYDFDSYLQQLAIVMQRVSPQENAERLLQLLNKTNQFNLTTKRFNQPGIQAVLADSTRRVYLYRVSDCFGDNGIVAVAIVSLPGKPGTIGKTRMQTARELPVIEELVMSCRVMGRNIEYAIVEDIENDLWQDGYEGLRGEYRRSAKNAPVEFLYEKLGYEVTAIGEDGLKEYRILFQNRPKRNYFVRKEEAD